MTKPILILMIGLLTGLTLISGCQTAQPTGRRAATDRWSGAGGAARSPSPVLPSARLREALAQAPPLREPPWYLSRNDAQPAVTTGVRLPTLERATTRSVDRQQSFDGRVFNSTRRTTYRSRISRAVR